MHRVPKAYKRKNEWLIVKTRSEKEQEETHQTEKN